MRRTHRHDRSLREVVVPLALVGLVAWKPQILVAAAVAFGEMAQRALTPVIMSLGH